MRAVIVPTINSNDTDARLVAWSKVDGDEVRQGETIAVLETTKASFELAAETDGLLHTAAEPGQRYEFHSRLGWIFESAAERDQFFPRGTAGRLRPPTIAGIVITKAAQALIDRHGIDEARVRALGKRTIKSQDLKPLLDHLPEPISAASVLLPSLRQQAIARVVSRSHATIPASFILKKIAVDAALNALAEFSRETKVLTGLPDLLVWIVARLPEQFPFFFGALGDELRFTAWKAGSIGVTFDVGRGLSIPVVQNAGEMPLPDVAKSMMKFRMRAARDSFAATDFEGGDLSISINMDVGVRFVQPIILPPQTCMLSLGAVGTEWTLDADGKPVASRFVELGAAFDHRVINGFEANAFLNAITRRIENPAPDEWR